MDESGTTGSATPAAATDPNVVVRLAGVSKHYGELRALSELDMDVRRGEVVGLLGPNGAGKTTTVRMLCGLMPSTAGSIHIGEHDVAQDPLEAKRLIGFVPDGAPLYPNLTPRQHLELVGRLHGIDEARLKRDLEHLMSSLGLSDRIDDPVGQFSRGMRQKTALACAILPQPTLLVLDEPLSGLDAPTAAMFKQVFRSWADRGGAVLYTSHLLDVVERVCDRMAILAEGKLAAIGTMDELRQRAGQYGTLEQVFGTLAKTEAPEDMAAALLAGLDA
ncbi:MAG: ABC-2 type transport system ATP-binding protein [Planctomycetota bacterium]|jgi:ABC-2 type transport system ATP-binding protein